MPPHHGELTTHLPRHSGVAVLGELSMGENSQPTELTLGCQAPHNLHPLVSTLLSRPGGTAGSHPPPRIQFYSQWWFFAQARWQSKQICFRKNTAKDLSNQRQRPELINTRVQVIRRAHSWPPTEGTFHGRCSVLIRQAEGTCIYYTL